MLDCLHVPDARYSVQRLQLKVQVMMILMSFWAYVRMGGVDLEAGQNWTHHGERECF